QMIHDKGWSPVLITDREEFREQVARLWQYGCEGIVNEPIIKVAEKMTAMACVVTPDTGILHLAQAVGTPTVGLFGLFPPHLRTRGYNTVVVPDHPQICLGHPEGRLCGWSCLERITAPMIMDGITRHIGKHETQPEQIKH